MDAFGNLTATEQLEHQQRLARIADDASANRIVELTAFIQSMARDRQRANGWRDAQKLVCLELGCMNAPIDWTPDGRGFCGQHAHVMD